MKPVKNGQLWVVRVRGWRSSSERDGSGYSVPFDTPFYVVATSSQEARQEAGPAVAQYLKAYQVAQGQYDIEAATVDMDSLVVAYRTRSSGEGWTPTEVFRQLQIGGASGRKYRLAVVLVED